MKTFLLSFYICLIAFCTSCDKKSQTEIYQTKRDNIVDVHDQIKEIKLREVFLNNASRPFVYDSYIILADYKSFDYIINVLRKTDFSYVGSFAKIGQGPGEITNVGHIAYDAENKKLLVSDHGKLKIFSYDLDSAIINPDYLPTEKQKMNNSQFISRYVYVNDTLSYGMCITPIGTNNFKQSMGKLNMETGEIKLMEYENPKLKIKRFSSAVSLKHGVYVECHAPYDLMTICSLEGDLKCNVYGPEWNEKTTDQQFFDEVIFCSDKIVARYSGDKIFAKDGSLTPISKLLVFDINGNYIKTLETGYSISRMCSDEENNRLILSMDEEMQFAYLDLDGIV